MRLDIRCSRLDNGLRVVLQPDDSVPLVAVHVMYHVGSRNEPPGRTGFAHLFEHLLFQGSENVPREGHFKYIQDAGGTLNGTTWFDRTNYFETVPANELDLALWLESDRMGFFKTGITQEKLDNQREVVKNERRQSYENRPYGMAFETLLHNAFPKGHPYRHPTIGYMEDLEAATLDDVRGFFDTYYAPSNAVVVLCGRFDPVEAMNRINAWFGPVPRRMTPGRPDIPKMTLEPSREVLEDRVQSPRVYLMFHSPAFTDPRFEATDALMALLSEGASTPLNRDLVYEQQIAAGVSTFTWPTEDAGMCFAVATGRPGGCADELEDALRRSIANSVESGVTKEATAGAVNRTRLALVNRVADVGERADALAHAAILRQDPYYVNDSFGRYESLTRTDLLEAAAVLDLDRANVVQVIPGKSGRETEQETE